MSGLAFSRSKSQLGTYERCPKQYEFNYIKRLKFSNFWQIKGIAAHEAIEANFRHKAEHGRDLPVDKVVGTFRAKVAEWFTARAGAEATVVFFEGQTRETLEQDGEAQLRTYMAELAPTIEPLMVEEWVELTLPSGLRIKGKLDLVDTSLCVRDTKFPTDEMRVEELVYEPDPPLYCAFFKAKTGRWPAGFVFDVVARGRAKIKIQPSAESLAFPDFERVVGPLVDARLADLERVDEAIKAGLFPRRPSAMNCNKCSYVNTCWWTMKPGTKTHDGRTVDQPSLAPALAASLAATKEPT